MDDILFCKGGGCTAKLGAGALSRVLSMLEKKPDENLLIGFDSHDDASVYKIDENKAIVSTLDFFPPMIEDPYMFGQIAAANALSDIYAMGGRPLTALNIVCFPETLDMNILGKILQGGNDKVIEAGAVLSGGHSIVDTEVKYGLSVTGIIDPQKIYTNNGVQEGDVLLFTKCLGTGIICSAQRVGAASETALKKAVDSMAMLNKYAADILAGYDVHACCDVTGFGFLVHLDEMLDASYSADVFSKRIPYFSECREYVKEFYITAAGQKNRNYLAGKVNFEIDDYIMEEILFDPQTSGGLLVSVSRSQAHAIVREMQEIGLPAQIVGEITARNEYSITVR